MKKLLSMFVALGLISFVGCGEEAPKKKEVKKEAKKEDKKEEKKAEAKK